MSNVGQQQLINFGFTRGGWWLCVPWSHRSSMPHLGAMCNRWCPPRLLMMSQQVLDTSFRLKCLKLRCHDFSAHLVKQVSVDLVSQPNLSTLGYAWIFLRMPGCDIHRFTKDISVGYLCMLSNIFFSETTIRDSRVTMDSSVIGWEVITWLLSDWLDLLRSSQSESSHVITSQPITELSIVTLQLFTFLNILIFRMQYFVIFFVFNIS